MMGSSSQISTRSYIHQMCCLYFIYSISLFTKQLSGLAVNIFHYFYFSITLPLLNSLFLLSLSVQAWERLEKAEHERGVALRKELIRQEKLELLAQCFDHKTTMRQAWLNENQRLVSQVGISGSTSTRLSSWSCNTRLPEKT